MFNDRAGNHKGQHSTDGSAGQDKVNQFWRRYSSAYGTGFTVTIEAAEGVTTGVSAADRITTVRAAIADGAKPSDLNRPGHVFPLRAQAGGVLTRGGHTEATIDLMTLAGFKPAGVLCELTNDDGTMARAPECIEFANKHNMPPRGRYSSAITTEKAPSPLTVDGAK